MASVISSPAAPASSAPISPKSSSAAATRVRVVDSLITGKRRNLDHIPDVEFLEGDLADLAFAARAVRRHGLRAAPGRDPVGAALGERSGHVEPREHRRVAQRARRRARRRRQAAGLRRLVVRVRQHADAAQARGHAAEPAVAVRAAEAGRGAVLPDVHAALRLRDGDDALLQRVRSAAGSRVAVLRRHLAVLDRAARRPPADHLRRRRADARLHLRRQRRRRRAARVRGAAGRGRSDERRDRRRAFRSTSCCA